MLDLGVLAVGHLRKEDCVESLSVEILFVARVLEVVVAWPGVLLAWEIVFSRLVRFENLSLNLARLKVWIRVPHLNLLGLGIVSSWTNSVLPES